MSDSLDIDQVAGPAAATGPQAATGPAAAAATADTLADTVTGTLALTPPAPVTAIAAPAAQDAIKLDPATVEKLDVFADAEGVGAILERSRPV